MAYKENGFSFFLELFKFVIALCLEEYVSYRQSLVYDENLRVNVDGNCESQTHKHTAGIRLYRLIDKITDVCKFDDVI